MPRASIRSLGREQTMIEKSRIQSPYIRSPAGLVRKHDARGNELWSRRFENSPISNVAVDVSGGVYVVGPGPGWERDIFVSKLSSQGNLLWTRQIGRGGGAIVAPDNSGIYVAWTT